jgi:hypothetical protein
MAKYWKTLFKLVQAGDVDPYIWRVQVGQHGEVQLTTESHDGIAYLDARPSLEALRDALARALSTYTEGRDDG